MYPTVFTVLLVSFSLASAASVPPPQPPSSSDVHLAVNPSCGPLDVNATPKDVNAGLPSLSSFSTIVSFGDSYTDGGKYDGSPLNPPILNAPYPEAGGRPSNGPVWAEYLANAAGATLKDYAARGAFVNANQWSGFTNNNDLLTQANTFISQPNRPAPDTTLYTLFFGIEDYVQSSNNGGASLTNAAQNLLFTILRLNSSPAFGKNFLIVDNHGRGTETPAGTQFKKEVYDGIASLRNGLGLNIAFADLSTVWNSVLGSSSGAAAFGYTSVSPCLSSPSTTVGSCSDPDHAFYWLPGTPTTVTHKVISEYVQVVLTTC